MGEGVLTAGARHGTSGSDAGDPAVLLREAGLERVAGSLRVAGVSLSEIAAAAGTPVYVYSAEVIRERYRALDRALAPVPHRICYAVKANGNLGVLRVLRELGAGADIVSSGEMRRALAAGFAADRIVFSGVGKTRAELEAAAEAGVGHINVESLEELELLGRVADERGRRIAVGLRVNPDVTTDTHPYISTGKGGLKFGIPTDQVLEGARMADRHPRLELSSLAMHLGSQLLDPAPYREGIARLVDLVAELRGAGITTLRHIDIGGGLGIRYADGPALEPAAFAEAVVPLLKPTGLTVLVEPGRFLVGSAGVLVAAVLYRKHSGGKDFVVVDAGMNELVRPSRYQAYHAIVELEAGGRAAELVDVVGPICETGDFLALDRRLPGLRAGDRIAVLGAGAYGFVMSSNYNTRPRPPEVVVDGGRWWISRPRETDAELFATERSAPEDEGRV